MVLADQQLRQELINYGEIVPPITQRNREQLRNRLEILRLQKPKRTTTSPSRSHGTSSPNRTRATASPSRATASPSRVTNSPTRTRSSVASPSKTLATNSPSRTRSSATTTNTGGSGRTTRSKQTPNLIELSDSDTEAAALGTRSTRSGQTPSKTQSRSIALRSQDSPTKSLNMTDDVEQSLARHRREIKQLLDSARDRNRATVTTSNAEQDGKSGRSSSPSSSLKTRNRRQSSHSETDTKTKQSPKSDHGKQTKSSPVKNLTKPIQSLGKKYWDLIKKLIKLLIVGSLLIGGTIFLIEKGAELLPRQELISCSIKNATECEDMKPVIAAVRKQLQVRTGEVDCGFRSKSDILVKRNEIERYLNEKGLKFNLGDEERWKALITYIVNKPVKDILIWNNKNEQINTTIDASQLSTKEALRSLTCRARQDVNKTLRNLFLLILGSTGLISLAWFLQRHSKNHEENESNFRHYLGKTKQLIEEQYEKHVKDPNSQPWLAITHIRDKLIPEEDQERLKHIWERVRNEISKQDSRIRSELQVIDGKKSDVWRWIKSAASSPKKPKSPSKNSIEDTDDNPSSTSDVGLTECLKLRNCFRSDDYPDDDEIDQVVDSIQARCANIKRVEHIGINAAFVYLKFSSNEAAAKGYHLLNNWKYQGREINVKYVRLNRYYEHFPEAEDINSNN